MFQQTTRQGNSETTTLGVRALTALDCPILIHQQPAFFRSSLLFIFIYLCRTFFTLLFLIIFFFYFYFYFFYSYVRLQWETRLQPPLHCLLGSPTRRSLIDDCCFLKLQIANSGIKRALLLCLCLCIYMCVCVRDYALAIINTHAIQKHTYTHTFIYR